MNTNGVFRIVYPERRLVPGNVIQGWYEDALANGELEVEVDHGDVASMARALDHAGHITLTGGLVI